MRKLFLACGVLVSVWTVSSCTRSAGFKKDQDYTQEQSNYYNHGAKTPAQRLEALGQPKKRVFVLGFWNDTPVKQADLGLFVADELKRGLFNSQRLIIPQDLNSEFTTSDFIQGDAVKVAQLIREGRRMGVAVIVIGKISKVVFRQKGDDVGLLRQKQTLAAVDVEVKVFDVGAGREMMAIGRSADTTSSNMVAVDSNAAEAVEFRAEMIRLASRNAVQLLIPDVIRAVEKMSWQGRIAKVQGTKVFVNAGRASGLVSGDILRVITQGDDIYDPISGAYLGRAQGQLKGTLEVVDFIGPDGAATDIHTGSNFQEGDLVQLY